MSKGDKKNDCRQTIQQHDESYTATCIFISLPLQEKGIDANNVYFFSNVNFCSTFRRDGHGKPPFRAGDLNNATPSSTVPAVNPSGGKNAESVREQVVTAAQQAPTVLGLKHCETIARPLARRPMRNHRLTIVTVTA